MTTHRDIQIGVGGSVRYSWWMVALVTPISIALAVAQAAVDKNRLAMNIIGAAVSVNNHVPIT